MKAGRLTIAVLGNSATRDNSRGASISLDRIARQNAGVLLSGQAEVILEDTIFDTCRRLIVSGKDAHSQ